MLNRGPKQPLGCGSAVSAEQSDGPAVHTRLAPSIRPHSNPGIPVLKKRTLRHQRPNVGEKRTLSRNSTGEPSCAISRMTHGRQAREPFCELPSRSWPRAWHRTASLAGDRPSDGKCCGRRSNISGKCRTAARRRRARSRACRPMRSSTRSRRITRRVRTSELYVGPPPPVSEMASVVLTSRNHRVRLLVRCCSEERCPARDVSSPGHSGGYQAATSEPPGTCARSRRRAPAQE